MILRTTLIWQVRQIFCLLLKKKPDPKLIEKSGHKLKRTIVRPIISKLPIFAVAFGAVMLSACASWLPEAHKLDLQQGNTVKLEQLEALEIGMSKDEVRRIMGSPMLADPFHNQRWDYIYRFLPRKGFERKSLLTLYFDEQDRLMTIDDSQYIEP